MIAAQYFPDVVAAVVNDVERAHALGGVRVIGELDQALLLEQEQGAGLVAVVGRDDDGRALGEVLQVGDAVAVDAERLIVDGADGDEVGTIRGVEAVEVGLVLEVVGVERAVGQSLVRQDVVVIGDDLELVAFVGEGLLDKKADSFGFNPSASSRTLALYILSLPRFIAFTGISTVSMVYKAEGISEASSFARAG